MKKLLCLALFCSIITLTACIPEEEEINWQDSTDYVFDLWTATPLHILYADHDKAPLFDANSISSLPVVSDKKLTDETFEPHRSALTYTAGVYYSELGALTGYYIKESDEVAVGFVYNNETYNLPCLIPFCHVNSTGSATSYLYARTTSGKLGENVLVTTLRYTKEGDEWRSQGTKITFDGNTAWEGGGETFLLVQE